MLSGTSFSGQGGLALGPLALPPAQSLVIGASRSDGLPAIRAA